MFDAFNCDRLEIATQPMFIKLKSFSIFSSPVSS